MEKKNEKKVNVKKLVKLSQAPALGKWNQAWPVNSPSVGDPTGGSTGCNC